MTNETKTKVRDWSGFVVFAGLAANAATAFAIQAWMTFGFGDEVWRIPAQLSVALVVALDLFAIMFMVLSYQLRGTGWPRFVATVVFVFAISCQVFAAEMFGEHKEWTTEVRWFSALPAVFLALSQEGVILWRTHRADRAAGQDEPSPAPPAKTAKPPAETNPQAKAAPPSPPARKTTPGPAPARPPVPSRKFGDKGTERDKVAAEVLAGGDKRLIAARAGVSTRSVENWMAAYRERHPEISKETPAEQAKGPAILPMQPPATPDISKANGTQPILNGGVSQ